MHVFEAGKQTFDPPLHHRVTQSNLNVFDCFQTLGNYNHPSVHLTIYLDFF